MQTTSWAMVIGVALLVHAATTWSATAREMRAVKALYSKKPDKNRNMASSKSSSMLMVSGDQGSENWVHSFRSIESPSPLFQVQFHIFSFNGNLSI